MSTPKSLRLDRDIEKDVEQYLKKNKSIRFPQLVNLALRRFMSEKQTIVLEPASDEEAMQTAKAAFDEHRDAMDRLK